MSYLSNVDISGILTERDFSDLTDSNDQVVFQSVVQQAEAEVDGFLRGRYSLPLQQPIDLMLVNILLDVFKFRLYQRRRPERITDDMIKMYDRAIFRLKDIQAGRLILVNERLGGVKNDCDLKVLESGVKKFGTNFTHAL